MRKASSTRAGVVGVALLSVLLAGCGGSESAEESPAPSSAAPSESSAADETTTQTSTPDAGADGECPAETAVTVTSTNGGYPGGIDWGTTYAVAERPYAGRGGDGRAVKVYIGTTERPLADFTNSRTELAADEAFLELIFTNGENDAGSGDYTTSVEGAAPNRLDLELHVTNRTTVQLDSHRAVGEAQLTDSGSQVCGSFTIEDKWTSATGTFVAAVESEAG